MKNKFSKIALSSTSQDESIMSIARQIFEILSNVGVETLYDDNLSGLEEQIGKKSLSVEHIIQNADLLIAIGGDGTMLNCSQKYGSKGIPILGINLGKLGFLTDIAPDEITTRLIDVVKGKFVEDKRFFLEASLKGKIGNPQILVGGKVFIENESQSPQDIKKLFEQGINSLINKLLKIDE